MASTIGDSQDWPPGTLLLQEQRSNDEEIILQPQPTDDPNDPLNWAAWRKYLNFRLVCLYALLIKEFICAATPTWDPMHDQLRFSWALLNDNYALGCVFLGIGAVILTPFGFKFGRRPLYLISTLVTFGVSIWSAKMQRSVDLLLVNVFSCLFGALSEVIIQLTIADIFYVHQRGLTNAIFIWTVQVGSSLGPLAAGYVTVSQGWRWVWWWNAIMFGVCIVMFGLLYEETKWTRPSKRINQDPNGSVSELGSSFDSPMKVAMDTKSNGKDSISSEPNREEEQGELLTRRTVVLNNDIAMRTWKQRLSVTASSPGHWKMFARHSWHPFLILDTFPAVLFVVLVYGVLMALQDAMSTTMSSRMTEPPYNFTPDLIGLMNLPQFIGVTISSLIIGPLSDEFILSLAHRNRGIFEPETRLWMILSCIPLVVAGALMFGYGIDKSVPWPVVAGGIVICSAGIAPINIVALTYITDSYTDILGDSMVGITFVRNSVSTSFIFSLDPWFKAVGVQNVILSMAAIAAFFLLCSLVFLKYGKALRVLTASKYRQLASKQMTS
ncbi:Major facilitator superfamily domain general substrate transporter [Penicillium cf. viridicatum]|uniref:Major facilitator superfamily domain general substrate transporter n=1 Tax=Penicillium cf. viridicatum TaxID=2972119 RepID=A0A9W9MUH0_9EURO|nr:Major facilitator superfamily domain general substrate transporter [Penicillium cf. viridicatum]